MKRLFLSTATFAIAIAMGVQANATMLALDIQHTGATTAAGFLAFEATNQNLAVPTQHYSAFGTTVSVDLTAANLPDGNLDFRAVARDGALGEFANDWIGADTRNGGVDTTLSFQFTGIPAGTYDWISWHQDGGSGTTNGNLNGQADWTLASGSGVLTMYNGNSNPAGLGALNTTFTTDGVNPVTFSMVMDAGQGGSEGLGTATSPNALFSFVTAIEITQVPEPSTFVLLGAGLAGLAMIRRRK